ncbi:MAG: TRAP transporter large permease subunit [Pseudomonadota bacterium]
MSWVPIALFGAVFVALLAGYPVALTLAGVSLLFALVGIATGHFFAGDLGFLSGRLFGVLTNPSLIAVPLFVFMGVVLERTRLAENLLRGLTRALGGRPGGLGFAVLAVGALLAASTGIVGATVVTMGLLALPVMLKQGYRESLATGTLAATGTLGQIIPPSIALVLLGDVLGNAYQQAQLSQGVLAPKTVSVGDLFAGALLPGLVLVGLYGLYLLWIAWRHEDWAPGGEADLKIRGEADLDLTGEADLGLRGEASLVVNKASAAEPSLVLSLVAPLVLMVAVLGSILGGVATPTEAAGVGAIGALALALMTGSLSLGVLRDVSLSTARTTAMVFFVLIGASLFSLVFRGYGGDELVQSVFTDMPGGAMGALAVVMLVVFLLGFMLDFIEITFVVVPIVGPVLLAMGLDPVWLGVLLAVNLQTSFLTPPFGFALFYLRGVTPDHVATTTIYRGVIPFVLMQLLLIVILLAFPKLATWLPNLIYG